MPQRLIPDKFKRRTLSRFTPYLLLTLPLKKSRLNFIFIVNYIFKLPSEIELLGFLVKLARQRIFSRRTLAKVGSNLNAKDLLGNVPDFQKNNFGG